MQHWMEINLVTLQNLIVTMTQIMHAVIKAKGSPIKYLFFLPGIFTALL